MSAASLRDNSWRRLAWELPAALLLLLVSLAGFLHLLAGPGALPTPAPPTPVQVDLVELPLPTPAVVPPAPEPPPPPLAQPEPPPPPPLPMVEQEPPPPVTEEDPPPPPPEPVAEAQPEPPPPKPAPPPPRSRPPEPAKPQTAALPPAAAPQPPSPPTSAAAAPSGSMGARALFKPMPEVPEALRHHALDLTALARFRVAASGAAEVELVEPTPDPTLNAALLETLKKWRFFPAMENGKAVASTIDIRIPITVR